MKLGQPISVNPSCNRYSLAYDSAATVISTQFADLSVTVTNSSSAHVKGSWAQLIASTATEIYGLVVRPQTAGLGGIDTSLLFDIGIGGSGSETVIVPNIDGGMHPTSRDTVPIPVYIPAGSRIAIRSQGARTSASSTFVCTGLGKPYGEDFYSLPPSLVTIGTDTATSAGTSLAAGTGTAKGAWTELTASCSTTLKAIIPMPNGIYSDWSTQVNNYDIAIGAAGSEYQILSGYKSGLANNEQTQRWFPFVPYQTYIPAGARISARYSRSTAGQTGTLSLIGVPIS